MFEEKPTTSQPGGKLPTAQPPADLPVDQPMPSRQEPEDILADVDLDKTATKGPTQPQDLGVPPTPAEPPKPKTEIKEPMIKRYKKVLMILVLVLIGGSVLAVGGWYVYNQFFAGLGQPPVNAGQPPINQNINQPLVNQNLNVNQSAVNQNVNVNQPPPPIDTDHDSLNDEEEALYGTDPNKVDTDSDGLTDRDEVKVFKTDPTNPDSDGDGYLDGEEVRAGYDPKGPGRLLKIE